MGFDKFGTKSFVSETKAEAFVDHLIAGKVMTTRCKHCKRPTFPPKMDCISCGKSEMDWIAIEGTGELIAFTTVMYGPDGFEKETPYTLGILTLSTGIKLFGQIDKHIPLNELKTGMKLSLRSIKLSNNNFSYQFEQL